MKRRRRSGSASAVLSEEFKTLEDRFRRGSGCFDRVPDRQVESGYAGLGKGRHIRNLGEARDSEVAIAVTLPLVCIGIMVTVWSITASIVPATRSLIAGPSHGRGCRGPECP